MRCAHDVLHVTSRPTHLFAMLTAGIAAATLRDTRHQEAQVQVQKASRTSVGVSISREVWKVVTRIELSSANHDYCG
jgi:hypothetical protein